MKWLRFSIGQLMVLVIYSAIGFSAFRAAGETVYAKTLTNLFYELTLGLLIVASLVSFFREGRSRARWLGFALFGWMHLKYGWPDDSGPAFDVPFRPRFPHTRVVQELLMRMGILFSGSAVQGMARWSVIQSGLIVLTGFFGMILGELVARSGLRQKGDPSRSGVDWQLAILMAFASVLYAALGVTAYLYAWDFQTTGRILDNAYFLATVSALSFAALVASVRQGLSRARWLAFALCGWVHIEFGWPDSSLNPLGQPYRPDFAHVYGLSRLLGDSVSPNTVAPNMFRWHIVQSTLTIATGVFGALIVKALPLESRTDAKDEERLSSNRGDSTGSYKAIKRV